MDVRPAHEIVPALRDRVLLHAGPPLGWAEMTGPMQGAAIGAALYEGWAETPEAAESLLAGGGVGFMPCHQAGGVGPMGGITSGSMPLLVVEERTGGGTAFCTFNEGVGRVLRFGANGPEVLERLRWLRDVAGPALGAALRLSEGIDLRAIMGRALTMGDEMHQRNVAATLLLLREVAPLLARAGLPSEQHAAVVAFVGPDRPVLPERGDGGLQGDCRRRPRRRRREQPGHGDVAQRRRVRGAAGRDRRPLVHGAGEHAPGALLRRLLGGGRQPGHRRLGDHRDGRASGAFCMAAAPAVVPYVGAGGFGDAIRITNEMLEITAARNPDFAIPALDFGGAPTGIDVRLVVATGIEPIINTGIAHRRAGVGQVGAGTVRAPLACFEQALVALADALG